ncbi:homeobox protein HAT3.1 [Gastrolobium bilobum]|uniref:homeobox protein HAT3.1 n=1 Tax=Gastrolobium bilobum TaxID=150636 RepID=UPI002AB178F6|nr:homeobox protein HAT3.1 [Gastrolobium bilobum]XP_061373883.1 homeobox protein HAT3.1 [Gastrolobium bilobum]
MTSPTGNLTSHNDRTAEKMGTEQCEFSEKTPRLGSKCLDSEHRVLDTVLTRSVTDEKSNQVSSNSTENSVILLPEPPQHDLEKTPQIGSECLDSEERVLGTVSTSSVTDEISNEAPAYATENSVILLPAPPQHNLEKTPQIGSECLDSEERVIGNVLTSSVTDEKSNQVSATVTENSVILLPAPPQHDLDCQTVEGSCLLQSTFEPVSVCLPDDKSENKCQSFSRNVQNEPLEISDTVTSFVVEDQTQSIPAQVNMSSVNELLDPASGDVGKNISSNNSERKSKSTTHMQLKHKSKRNSKLLKKYMLRSLGTSDRALRSRTREKPKAPEPNSNLVDVNNDGVKRESGRKKKKRRGEGITDQFSRIRAQLRYLLNRVSYEQSLIDAYSGEGWKGYSMEKLKPEKELQRARSEILRRKLKIRDLFQNLDSLCAEGRLPDSLFDSEGEIDSEDIFCAKCQSKESGTNNDIILCDGACDRGFHQLCLDPPLLTEDIPPGDEGWLCPGCDCKDDCIELVNDSLGTSLSLSDTWKRLFPEAAAAARNNIDNMGLPSDDSDDDDYNPNAPEDVEVEGGEPSSDESEYASASEKLEDSRHEDQYLGLPSEDSEDDDFDPNGPDPDSRVMDESSSSDFTSDSEDLAAAIEDNMSPGGQDEDIISASLDDIKNFKGSSGQKCKVGRKPSIVDELSSLLEPDPGQEGSTPVSGKRQVDRLDYKKLYDETYQSDTSDDEDWTATASPSRKRTLTGKVTPVSPNGNASNNSVHTPRRNTHQNKVENTNNSPPKSLEGPGKSGSSDKKPGSSAYKRLGEAVVQRLYKSFKENQYPDRTTKESLAQELGLTYQQVTKWFDNTRWSFRHSSQRETVPGRNASQQATNSIAENKGEWEWEVVSQEVSGEKPKTSSSGKRKHLSEPQASEAGLVVDDAATMSPACSSKTHEMQIGNKIKTRKRK